MNEIRQLFEKRLYQEALAACDDLMLRDLPSKTDVLRWRSNVWRALEKYDAALRDRKEIIANGDADEGDYFSAGDLSLWNDQYAEALPFLEACLEIEESKGLAWFKDTTRVYLFYIFWKTGQIQRADEVLNALESDGDEPEEPYFIPNVGFVFLAELREKLNVELLRNGPSKVTRFRFE